MDKQQEAPQEPALQGSEPRQTTPTAPESNQLISTEENAKLMNEWWFKRRDPYCA